MNVENRLKHETLAHTVGDFVVNGTWPDIDRLGEDQGSVTQPCTSEGTVALDIESRKESILNLHDSEQGVLLGGEKIIEPCIASEDFHHSMDKIEKELPSSNQNVESRVPEFEWSERDETVALWVKWRGKWQAGIRCARADCPLATLKSRPTHDRKKYFVVFFPHTKTYSWANMQFVRPIHEFPEPIAHKAHDSGLVKVQDLGLAHRFIMQRLAVDMLNISEQLHIEALIESARKVTVWKDFALEASLCNGYSDLGGMLVKLQSMILQQYMNPDWLKNSLESWAQRCQNAQSAESLETLKEELEDSVLWNEIEALWDAAVQPELGSEWKTWKEEAMKWFSTSNPIASGKDVEQCFSDDFISADLQVSNKRAKLEVRRADMHATQVESNISHDFQFQANNTETESGFSNSGDHGIVNGFVYESWKERTSVEGAATSECPGNVVDRWDEIVVESGNNDFSEIKAGQETPARGGSAGKSLEQVNRYRQCSAFIEAKGRQCIRWANDDDVYCCVHLAYRPSATTSKAELSSPVNTPMCEGTTVHGTKCKHRSQYGSTFCKKHRPQTSQYLMDVDTTPSSLPGNVLKRSHSQISPMVAAGSCKETIASGEVRNSTVNSVYAAEQGTLDGTTGLTQNLEATIKNHSNTETVCCIGSYPQNSIDQCPDRAKLHTLYCEKHLPNFLKRARNGKSRIITKENFLDFLRECSSREQKLHLHRACVLLHGYVKSMLSNRNPASKDTHLQWILSEASKDLCVGRYLMKLVSQEKKKLKSLWGFDVDNNKQVSSSVSVFQPAAHEIIHRTVEIVKCKICMKDFPDDEMLGAHWMDAHKSEAQSLFRGYSCALCLNSFTDKKVLETHVGEKHGIQFVEHNLLFRCIPCGSQFMNPEQLWVHVLSVHSKDFKLCTDAQQHTQLANQPSQLLDQATNEAPEDIGSKGGSQRFLCKLCGLKFDILADLGRHHQATHMGLDSVTHIKRGTHLNSYKAKSGRVGRPRIRNRGNIRMNKRFQASSSASIGEAKVQCEVGEAVGLGRLAESQCSAVAKILFGEIQKAKPRPSNSDILSVARSTCCKISFQSALEEQFGVLPERLYLKAAKLCSELGIQVQWHQEGFACPKSCKPLADPCISSLTRLPSDCVDLIPSKSVDTVNRAEEWEMDECHYIIESEHIKKIPMEKVIVLCEDLSFGRESVPVNCIVDGALANSVHATLDEGSNDTRTVFPMPWEGFTYVTERLLDPSLGHDTESTQLGCACPSSICSPEACDHVYLFENDYEDAKDIYGELMHGKFPYDSDGRIILEEGYLVSECNSMCACDRTCQNRVLQNGVHVKLEVFKTENKGWALRAGKAISRGSFVCEYIGEVLNYEEANKRHSNEGCSYLFKIQADIDDMGGLNEGVSHVIDASRYGNVSRFINHSCSPNLVTYQVLIESMDCQLAHIGLYASRDIAAGEELAFDYHQKLLTSEGQPCHCGAPNCRGKLD